VTDERIIEYLRSRGAAHPPADLVRSVMAAVDADPGQRSRFGAALPVLVAAGAAAVIFVLALLFGFGRDVGPAPTPLATPSPDAMAVTVEELQAAVAAAVDALRESPGVEGTGTSHVLGELGSAIWFSWRPGGDQVVVTRTDVDVTQSAWWLADPDAGPPGRGEQVATVIQVLSGDTYYRAAEEMGGESGWTSENRSTALDVLGVPFPAILDGAVEPWEASFATSAEGEASVTSLADGGAAWTLTSPYRQGREVTVFEIGPDGALRSMSTDFVDVEPSVEDAPFVTSTLVQLAILDDPEPIPAPDVDAGPDPSDFGLPTDFPLGGAGSAMIDYRVYVEDALAALEAYHWNSANIDWGVARSAALDGLPEDPSAAQAHARIQAAIGTFDVFTTAFIRPQDVPRGGIDGGGSDSTPLPEGDRLGDVGYLTLPTPSAYGPEAFGEYLRATRDAMAAAEATEPACGWVVDLRDYDAFAWGPSVFALGGVFGEGRIVTFRSPAGEWGLETDDAGVVSSTGFDASDDMVDSPYIASYASEVQRDEALAAAIAATPPHVITVTDAPVAVLVSNATASGGEQTVVAFLGRPSTRIFGAPTGGMPIVAPNLRMADGAVLRIPTWIPVDRDGTSYTANIVPDEVIGDTRTLGSDAILDAALEWLENQPGCS
jgi:carboxyl-terminal processing protease